MRHYETIYIVNPNLADEECRDLIDKFNKLIEENKGIIITIQEWGKRSLAYLIKKYDKGFYVLVEFCATQELIAVFERGLKLDDRILKFQTVKLAEKADPEELLKKRTEGEKESQEEQVNKDTEQEPEIKEKEIKDNKGVENAI